MPNIAKTMQGVGNRIERSLSLSTSRLERYQQYIHSYIQDQSIILDLGCEQGLFALDCAKYGQVIAVDIRTQQLIRMKKDKNIYRICCDAHFLPLQDNVVNATIAISILEHVENVKNVLGEIERTLKPKGNLIIQLPNMQFYIEPHTRFPLLFLMPQFVKNRVAAQNYAAYKYYTDFDLSRKKMVCQLETAAFSVKKIEPLHHGIRTPFWPPGWFIFSQKKKGRAN